MKKYIVKYPVDGTKQERKKAIKKAAKKFAKFFGKGNVLVVGVNMGSDVIFEAVQE